MSLADVQQFLSGCVARVAGRPVTELDLDAPIVEYGLDSVSALTVVFEAEERFGVELDPADLWDYPTLRSLSGRIRELADH